MLILNFIIYYLYFQECSSTVKSSSNSCKTEEEEINFGFYETDKRGSLFKDKLFLVTPDPVMKSKFESLKNVVQECGGR